MTEKRMPVAERCHVRVPSEAGPWKACEAAVKVAGALVSNSIGKARAG
jgi:hypothetical protein